MFNTTRVLSALFLVIIGLMLGIPWTGAAAESPTATPGPSPTYVIQGTYTPPAEPPGMPIPPAAATPVPSGDDVVTILVLGSDSDVPGRIERTDVIIGVVLNRTRGTVSMLHFPRDLFVYAPNWTMTKLNTVFVHGVRQYGDGSKGGARLLRETMRYNFGLKVDFYARVDFTTFKQIIDAIGPLKISVDCAIQGNRLKSPELDKNVAENYELFTLNIGKYAMSSDLALWYVRSRGSSTDMDRGRRQMEVLRAIWRQAREQGLIGQVTKLWPTLMKLVDTDLTLNDAIGLVPLALTLDPNNIQRIIVRENIDFQRAYTPGRGEFVWVMEPGRWPSIIQNLVLPPRNRLSGEVPIVELGAAALAHELDDIAADRLSWEGFQVRRIGGEGLENRELTIIRDFTGGAKPEYLETLRRALRVREDKVFSEPSPDATADFRVEMGSAYKNSCIYRLR